MNSLKFKSLRILSDVEKKAAHYKFGKRFNLIVGTTNSVGKSHIVKNIFWAFGCESYLDSTWKDLDCKVLVEFSVGSKDCSVARHGDRIFLSEENKPFVAYPRISGEFSRHLSEILHYHVLLPVRDKEEVTTPPPAYYFLPFYINQTHSWSKAWNSFENLSQFSGWQRDVIQYHVGVINKAYFDVTDEIYVKKRELTVVTDEISRIDTALHVVSQFIPNTETTVDVNEFEAIRVELELDISQLNQQQEMLFEKVAILRADKEHIDNQLQIARQSILELESDYAYSLEQEDEIECPVCGVVHDNSLVSRFSLLSDKDQAEQVVKRLEKQQKEVSKTLVESVKELDDVKLKINVLNEKYIVSDKEANRNLHEILDSFAVAAVRKKVGGHRKDKAQELYDKERDIASLDDERKSDIYVMRKKVNEEFQSSYPALAEKLHAHGVNASGVKGPLNYSKVLKSGGGDAEKTRAMLAYYLAIYNLIHKFGSEVLSPLVIDTPRQHEQADQHYERIVNAITNNTPTDSQIFLCGMDSPQLDPLKQQATVITLEKERSLLERSKYKEIKDYIGTLFEVN